MTQRLLLLAATVAGALLVAPVAVASPTAEPRDASDLPSLTAFDSSRSHINKTSSAAVYATLKDWRAAKRLAVACWDPTDWETLAPRSTTMAFWDPHTPRTLHVSPGICELVSEAVDDGEGPNASRAYALTTLTHEAIHALGVRNEAQTECYATQMVPQLAIRLRLTRPSVWGNMAVKAARGAAPKGYWSGASCRDGGKWDLLPQMKNLPAGALRSHVPSPKPTPAPAPPPVTPPIAPTPTPPVPPQPSVVFDQTYTWEAEQPGILPMIQVNHAARIEISIARQPVNTAGGPARIAACRTLGRAKDATSQGSAY